MGIYDNSVRTLACLAGFEFWAAARGKAAVTLHGGQIRNVSIKIAM